jgi:hypothetical protein
VRSRNAGAMDSRIADEFDREHAGS